MPVTCHKGGAAIIDNTIYLVGGWDNAGTAHSNLYLGVIDPSACETITWGTGPAMPYAVAAAGVTQGQRLGNWYIYNEIYVCGGDDLGDWGGTAQVWKLPWFTPGVAEKPDKPATTFSFGFAPNMTNPTKENSPIYFRLTKPGNVMLRVYDRTGRLVSTLVQGFETEGKTATHKLILVK